MKTTQERIITKMHKHDLWKQKTNLMLFEAVYENHHKPTNQLYYQDKHTLGLIEVDKFIALMTSAKSAAPDAII